MNGHEVSVYDVDGELLRVERRDPCSECLEGQCDDCEWCVYFRGLARDVIVKYGDALGRLAKA